MSNTIVPRVSCSPLRSRVGLNTVVKSRCRSKNCIDQTVPYSVIRSVHRLQVQRVLLNMYHAALHCSGHRRTMHEVCCNEGCQQPLSIKYGTVLFILYRKLLYCALHGWYTPTHLVHKTVLSGTVQYK